MGLIVRDVMTQRVVTARQTAPFRELLALLREHHISAVPVVDTGDRVVGVVSDSDLYLKQIEPLRHRWLLLGRRRRVEQAKALSVTAAQLMSASLHGSTGSVARGRRHSHGPPRGQTPTRRR